MEPKTTIIQHAEHERVEGVTYKKIELPNPEARAIFHGDCAVEGWISQNKDCFYLKNGGWSEVSQKQDVTGKVEINKDENGYTTFLFDKKDVDLSPNFTFIKAQAVVLPEGMTWEDLWKQLTQGSPKVYWDYLKEAATTVIQVWQKGAQ